MANRRALKAASVVALAAFVAAPDVARAADYTWSGGAPVSAPNWSDAANWSGGLAPADGEMIDTLSFPALTTSVCRSAAPTLTCGVSINDRNGLVVGSLVIDDALANQGGVYAISGHGITLTGGLQAVPSGPPTGGAFVNRFTLPITLIAPQTWTVGGQSGGAGLIVGPITGAAETLTIDVAADASLGMFGDNEVGPVSIIGPGPTAGPQVSLQSLQLPGGATPALNSRDGNPITVTGARLSLVDAELGPVRITRGALTVGLPGSPTGAASATAVTFDQASEATLTLSGSRAVAGANYAQLRSTGTVSLGGAALEIVLVGDQSGACPAPPMGTVYTLVSTTGKLTGAFTLGNGENATVSYSCSPIPSFALEIDYHEHGSPQSVTATVVPAPPPGVRPGVAGAAPVSGLVLVRRRGRRAFTRLRSASTIPADSEVDATRGRVRIFAATNAQGGIESAELYGGRFIIRQKKRAHPLTTFALSEPLSCRPAAAASSSTTARRKHRRHRRRHVWVTEKHGRFNTRGQYVSTSVQGTTWLTADACRSSRVRVRRGTVVVHDLVRHRTVSLHSGQSITVRKRR
jgi:hypothetical protein